ncbi:uncharacterized protein AAEQ78_025726 isoform 2-T2 [Lycaon pictus]
MAGCADRLPAPGRGRSQPPRLTWSGAVQKSRPAEHGLLRSRNLEQRRGHVRTQQGSGHLQARKKGPTRNQPQQHFVLEHPASRIKEALQWGMSVHLCRMVYQSQCR